MTDHSDYINKQFVKARLLRNEKKFSDALGVLLKLKEYMVALSRAQFLPAWSRLHFEIGIIFALMENTSQAADEFKLSVFAANEMNDTLRACIGEFRGVLTLYLADQLPASEAFVNFKKIFEKVSEIDKIPEADEGLLSDHRYNLLKRLIELSFENDDPSFAGWLNSFRALDREPSTIHKLILTRFSAFEAMALGAYDKAVDIFASYIIVPDCEICSSKDHAVTKFAATEEERGNEILKFARAVKKSSSRKDFSLEKIILGYGISLGTQNSNTRFNRLLSEELDGLN